MPRKKLKHMPEKQQSVAAYFGTPTDYLSGNLNIPLRVAFLQSLLGPIESKRVLDIGCGDGSLSRPYLGANQVTFLDLSESMMDIVRDGIPPEHLGNAEFLVADFERHSFQHRFDLILCIGVVAYIRNIDGLLAKLHGLLEDTGSCIVLLNDRARLLSRLFDWHRLSEKRYGFSLARHNAVDIKRRVHDAGFHITAARYAWRPYPFFRLLPQRWRLPLLTRINGSPGLSECGSELWLLLTKEAPTGDD